MKNCIELIYDRFRIEVYKPSGITFAQPWQQHKKALEASDLSFRFDPILVFSTEDDEASGKFRLNDSFDDVTTTVSEESNDHHQYEVTLHCEFRNLSPAQILQLEQLDCGIFHYVLRSGFKGQEITRVVRCDEEGQARASITNSEGVTILEVKIVNVNGITTVG